MKPAAPIFDGTAQTDEDGIVGGQGRTRESLWRDGYVAFAVGFALLALIVGAALWLAFR